MLRTDADRSFEPAILRLSTLPDRLWSPHGIYLIEDVALQSDVCSLVLQSLQTFGCNLENESHISNTSFHFHSSTGFPIKDARLLNYQKSIFHIILPFQSSLNRSGIFFNFERRASFLGNPVDNRFLFNFHVLESSQYFEVR